MIKAPWTPDQVKNLQDYQNNGTVSAAIRQYMQ